MAERTDRRNQNTANNKTEITTGGGGKKDEGTGNPMTTSKSKSSQDTSSEQSYSKTGENATEKQDTSSEQSCSQMGEKATEIFDIQEGQINSCKFNFYAAGKIAEITKIKNRIETPERKLVHWDDCVALIEIPNDEVKRKVQTVRIENIINMGDIKDEYLNGPVHFFRWPDDHHPKLKENKFVRIKGRVYQVEIWKSCSQLVRLIEDPEHEDTKTPKELPSNWKSNRSLEEPFIWPDDGKCKLEDYKNKHVKINGKLYKVEVRDIEVNKEYEIKGTKIINFDEDSYELEKEKTEPEPKKTEPEPEKTEPKPQRFYRKVTLKPVRTWQDFFLGDDGDREFDICCPFLEEPPLKLYADLKPTNEDGDIENNINDIHIDLSLTSTLKPRLELELSHLDRSLSLNDDAIQDMPVSMQMYLRLPSKYVLFIHGTAVIQMIVYAFIVTAAMNNKPNSDISWKITVIYLCFVVPLR